MATRIRVGQINFNTTVDVNNQRITNLATPTADSDAANKAYVDAVAQGLKWKEPVKVATTGNITLSGTQTIDGVSVLAGDRVLVWQQTDAKQNGIYVVATGAWSRASDADTGSELESAACFVSQGNTYADKGFVCTSDDIVIGTTNIDFVTFTTTGGLTAGNGINIVGTTISVKPATDAGIQVDSNGVAAKLKTNGGILVDASGLYVNPTFVKDTAKSDYVLESFTGNGTTTDFTLTFTPYYGSGNNNIVVALNGLVQRQGVDYTVDVPNKQIDFATAPANGDIIVVYYSKA